jgi:hypothetical protein
MLNSKFLLDTVRRRRPLRGWGVVIIAAPILREEDVIPCPVLRGREVPREDE